MAFPIGKSWIPESRLRTNFPDWDILTWRAPGFPLYFPYGISESMTPQEIGRIVRETRRAQGLRQDQLAGAAGVGVRFLVELEAGKVTAQIGKALAVLAALGCRMRIEPPRMGPPPGTAGHESRP